MKKKVIIAFFGKSATGKDTTAKRLERQLKDLDYNVGRIISDTTRPPRVSEKNEIDYNFITNNEFAAKRYTHGYLEYTEFKGWEYGTPKTAIKYDINIGVFNIIGILSLLNKFQDDYIIIPIQLITSWPERLRRSIEREHAFHWEYIRRMQTDRKDFNDKSINRIKFLSKDKYIEIKNKTMLETISVIIEKLSSYKII